MPQNRHQREKGKKKGKKEKRKGKKKLNKLDGGRSVRVEDSVGIHSQSLWVTAGIFLPSVDSVVGRKKGIGMSGKALTRRGFSRSLLFPMLYAIAMMDTKNYLVYLCRDRLQK